MTSAELRDTRRRLNLTQEQLGALCGVTERQVHRWETDASPVPAYLPIVLDSIEHGPARRQLERRYHWLLNTVRPRFSQNEALAICDALNGVMFPDPETVPLVWANVAETPGLGEKWQIDQSALAERLRQLGPAEALAVVESVERFWPTASWPTDAVEETDDGIPGL